VPLSEGVNFVEGKDVEGSGYRVSVENVYTRLTGASNFPLSQPTNGEPRISRRPGRENEREGQRGTGC
jgi:hypothetical protein